MPLPAGTKTRKRYRTITEVDHDTWAESGGTGGMFGAKWARGRIRLVDSPDFSPIVRDVRGEY